MHSQRQPVLEAEDKPEQEKIPVLTQLRQDPEQARKHQESNLVTVITVADVLSSSNDPGSVLSPLNILLLNPPHSPGREDCYCPHLRTRRLLLGEVTWWVSGGAITQTHALEPRASPRIN